MLFIMDSGMFQSKHSTKFAVDSMLKNGEYLISHLINLNLSFSPIGDG